MKTAYPNWGFNPADLNSGKKICGRHIWVKNPYHRPHLGGHEKGHFPEKMGQKKTICILGVSRSSEFWFFWFPAILWCIRLHFWWFLKKFHNWKNPSDGAQNRFLGRNWAKLALGKLKIALLWPKTVMSGPHTSLIFGLWSCRGCQKLRKGLGFKIKPMLVKNMHFRRS